jgi:methylated-DNA-[protein]-cysteine S-methyltransferase
VRLMLDRVASPIGEILLVTDGAVLRALDFADHEARMRRLVRLYCGAVELGAGPAPGAIRDALAAYFTGEATALDRIPVETGGSAFQRLVWQALRAIPAGETVTYGRLADRIGAPRAHRAVGAANGANPVSIVVPCHRLVGASGALTGYGGGIERKAWLLRHERRGEAAG